MLEPDSMRGVPLDMDQYTRLFGTARVPTEVRDRLRVEAPPLPLPLPLPLPCLPRSPRVRGPCADAASDQRGCKMEVHADSRHIVVLRRGQFCASPSPAPASLPHSISHAEAAPL